VPLEGKRRIVATGAEWLRGDVTDTIEKQSDESSNGSSISEDRELKIKYD